MVHQPSKVTYEEFNNAVCVNSIYLVNTYEMPFVIFVGVANHMKLCQQQFGGIAFGI